MLVMSKGALSVHQAETYYQEKYSEDDYYTESHRVTGQWYGRAAETLGLSGAVSEEDFRAILRGTRPGSGEVLVSAAVSRDERRADWDATFNAPKSVSIQALVGEDARLVEAHRHAVDRALSELEQFAQARRHRGQEWITTGNFVAARFEHIAARPSEIGIQDGYGPDPHLHTHVVIANMTLRPDGMWRSLDPIEIYRSQSFADRGLPLGTWPRGPSARISNQCDRGRRTLGAARIHARTGDGIFAQTSGHRGTS
jgi:conjugative relaxase-like TrwC/TraI family protein